MKGDTMAVAAPKKPSKQQQLDGEGFEHPVNEAVEKAAEAYREKRDERMKLTKQEKELKRDLRAALKAAEIEEYHYTDEDGTPRKAYRKMTEEKVGVCVDEDAVAEDEPEEDED
jgi:hypothetical protein